MLNSAYLIITHLGWRKFFKALLARLVIFYHELFNQGRLVKKPIYDYWMYLDTSDRGISRTLLLFGQRELEHKLMLEKIVTKGMRIFDIGANIGYYAMMEAKLVGPDGEIIAIEPSPRNIKLLKKNIALNHLKQIKVIPGAVSDKAGNRQFHLSEQTNLNTFHAEGSAMPHLTGETVEVATRTVPELIKEFGNVDLIRMDVEGHEVEVINGILPEIEAGETKPMVIFETHLSRYGEHHDMRAPLKRLFKQGYVVRYLASSSKRGSDIIEQKGYQSLVEIPTDFTHRRLYEFVKPEDAIELICETGGARTILLAPAQER